MATTTAAKDRMSSRERLLAAYRGLEVDRLPWWAKVCNPTWRTSQPEAVRAMDDRALLDAIAADGIFGGGGGVTARRPRVRAEDVLRDHERTTVTHTPDGDLVERWREDPATRSWHPVEFPVKTREDLKRFAWCYEGVTFDADETPLAAARRRKAEIGERGVLLTACGTSPMMHLVEHVIGPVNVHLMLADFRDEMEALMDRMNAVHLEHARQIARHSPADIVSSVENTSTTLISPAQFERYCYGHLCNVGRAVEAEGKMHELHMCGHTKALLEKIDTIPAASIEAFTSPTLGNTRLADGRTRAPSKCLVGGTNCMIWLRPVEEIQRYIEGELAACRDHRRIVLTTAGVAPPACPVESFRRIGEWIRTVPVRL